SLVELQCKGITATGTETINGTTYNYLDLIENPPATDTIRAYYSGTVAATSRVNRITGQIRHTDPNTPVIDVDTGPGGYDPQILEGSLQTVAQGTIAWAKTFPEGTQVSVLLSGKVASASFPGSGFFFMQEAGIGSGIRVDTSIQTWPQPGQEVSIASYEVSTSSSQRVLTASANDITLGTAGTVAPVGVNNRSLAGGAFNVLTPGATGAFGLNNIGLLVRTWGRTTDVQSNYLYITDGSDDLGVKVDLTQGGGNPISHNLQVGDYAAITGISLLESSGSDLVRVIKPRDSDDLNQMFRDTTAPNPGTAMSPGFANSSPITVTYSGASDSGTGLKKVELWYKKGVYGTWTNSGQTGTSSSGSFSFALDGEDTYYFDLVAEDYTGNRSTAASGDGDCRTIYEIALNASGRAFTHNQYLYPGGPLIRSTAHDEAGIHVREVTQTYGSEGELVGCAGSTDPATYQYDAAYRVKTILDGKSQATNYFYDNVGNLTSIVYPGGASIQYPEHDGVGNVLQRIDANTAVTKYHYSDPVPDDPNDKSVLGQLTHIEYPDTPDLDVHFGYDSYGRLTEAWDGVLTRDNGNTIRTYNAFRNQYTFDDLNIVTNTTTAYYANQQLLMSRQLSYQYYPDGSTDQITTPVGNFVYTYDAAGHPTGLTNPSSEAFSWTYYDNNWLSTQTSPEAVATCRYSSRGFINSLVNKKTDTTLLSEYVGAPYMTYDSVGNLLSMTANLPNVSAIHTGLTSYQYATRNQLVQEQSTRNNGYTNAFIYDDAGNPTTFEGCATRNYNAKNQRSDTGFAYDDNGNSTSYKGASPLYDPENRMTSYGTLTATYRGDGLRAFTQTTQGATYYLYCGGLPILEMNSAGTITAINTFGPNGLLARRQGTQSNF
ncbi:MAG: hypothetical protein ACYC0V_22045, partial [Armatimonadota bacterium]